ncbi:uncharacterized protein LOC117645717 [Thrips palmi]|uniref:Uncharacterized protein LOC117645717 n=1 Tax=Thrips palmi TaxID=161013 RepID=A0A6P8YPS9_THRPL|nr:uncharacterized protein LOC117645717 [Thrips palmi]
MVKYRDLSKSLASGMSPSMSPSKAPEPACEPTASASNSPLHKVFGKSGKVGKRQQLKRKLYSWIREQRLEGIPLNDMVVERKASEMKEEMKIKDLELGWLTTFKQEYNVKLVTSCEELEEQLITWITDQRSKGLLLSDKIVQDRALALKESLNAPSFNASAKWLLDYKRRYGLKLVVSCEELEEQLFSWITHQKSEGVTLKFTDIQKKVTELQKTLNSPPFDANQIWFSEFKKRYRVSLNFKVKELEDILHSWIVGRRLQGDVLTDQSVTNKMLDLIGNLKVSLPKPVPQWLKEFKKNYGIRLVASFVELEEQLYAWIIQQKSLGTSLNDAQVQAEALTLHQRLNTPAPFEATHEWLTDFYQRYSVTLAFDCKELKDRLHSWIVKQRLDGVPLSQKMVHDKAIQLNSDLKINSPSVDTPQWLSDFIIQYSIRMTVSCEELEEQLYSLIVKEKLKGNSLSDDDIYDKALDLNYFLNTPLLASDEWVADFKRRYGLVDSVEAESISSFSDSSFSDSKESDFSDVDEDNKADLI